MLFTAVHSKVGRHPEQDESEGDESESLQEWEGGEWEDGANWMFSSFLQEIVGWGDGDSPAVPALRLARPDRPCLARRALT